MFRYAPSSDTFYGYPSTYPAFTYANSIPMTTSPYLPSYPSYQPSPRDRYLAALAEAQAAEADYLAIQAAKKREEEEAFLRGRRLAELEFHRQLEEDILLMTSAGCRRPQLDALYASQRPQRLPRRSRGLFSEAGLASPQLYAPQHSTQPSTYALNTLIQQLQALASAQASQRSPIYSRSNVARPSYLTQPSTALQHPKREHHHQSPAVSPFVDLFNYLVQPQKPYTAIVPRASSPVTRAAPVPQQEEVDTLSALLGSLFGGAPVEGNALPAVAPRQTVAPQLGTRRALEKTPERDISDSQIWLQEFYNALINGALDEQERQNQQQGKQNPKGTERVTPAPKQAPVPASANAISASSSTDQKGMFINADHIEELSKVFEALMAGQLSQQAKPRDQPMTQIKPTLATPVHTTPKANNGKGKEKAVVDQPSYANLPSSSLPKDANEARKAISEVEKIFNELANDFAFPTNLDFEGPETAASTAISKLKFTAHNHPVRFYEQALGKLLAKLDAIESFGDEAVRNKRKDVVRKVEKALDEVETEVEGRYRTFLRRNEKKSIASTHESPTPAPAPMPTPVSPRSSPLVEVVEDPEADDACSVHSFSDAESLEDLATQLSHPRTYRHSLNLDLQPYEVVFDEEAAARLSDTPSTPISFRQEEMENEEAHKDAPDEHHEVEEGRIGEDETTVNVEGLNLESTVDEASVDANVSEAKAEDLVEILVQANEPETAPKAKEEAVQSLLLAPVIDEIEKGVATAPSPDARPALIVELPSGVIGAAEETVPFFLQGVDSKESEQPAYQEDNERDEDEDGILLDGLTEAELKEAVEGEEGDEQDVESDWSDIVTA